MFILLMIPIFLETFDDMCLIWSFHVKWSSIISPRNSVSYTRMIFSLSILMLIKLLLTFFLFVSNMKFVFFYIE